MGAGQRFRRHVPPLLFLLALALMIVAIARPGRGRHAAVAARDRHPRDGRLGQHARHRRQAEPPRRGAGRRASVRRRPAADHAHRRRVVRRDGVGRAAADAQHARTSSPRSTASSCSAAPRSAAASSSRSKTIFPDAEFDLRSSNPRREAPKAGAARPGQAPAQGRRRSRCRRARTRRPRSSCSPTARRPPAPTRSRRRAWPPSAACASTRSASARTSGEIIGAEGWSMRVRLDEEALKTIANLTRGEYFYAGTAADLKKIYQTLNTQARSSSRRRPRSPRCSPPRRRASRCSRPCCRCCGSTGSCDRFGAPGSCRRSE